MTHIETSKSERFDIVSRYVQGETLFEIARSYGWRKGRAHGKRRKKWFWDLRKLIVRHGVSKARDIYFSDDYGR